jgi:hypothetical protein
MQGLVQDPQTGRWFVNGIEVRFMSPEGLLVRRPLKYIDSFSILALLHQLAHRPLTNELDPPNFLLTGPKGVGKTLLFMSWAQREQLPYITLNCSLESKDRHTKGGFVQQPGHMGGGFVYVLGKIPTAIIAANLTGAAMLVFEELNALPPEQQKNLNSLTDFRREIEIPELGWNLALQEDASLLVAATMNSGGGGIYELNEDLQSRFVPIELGYPMPDVEKAILKEMAPTTLSDEQLEMLIRIAQQTRQETTSYALSTRDLVQLLDAVHRVGWQEAMFIAGQKFNSEDRKLVLDRIKDITKLSIWSSVNDRAQTYRTLNPKP